MKKVAYCIFLFTTTTLFAPKNPHEKGTLQGSSHAILISKGGHKIETQISQGSLGRILKFLKLEHSIKDNTCTLPTLTSNEIAAINEFMTLINNPSAILPFDNFSYNHFYLDNHKLFSELFTLLHQHVPKESKKIMDKYLERLHRVKNIRTGVRAVVALIIASALIYKCIIMHYDDPIIGNDALATFFPIACYGLMGYLCHEWQSRDEYSLEQQIKFLEKLRANLQLTA